MGCSWPTLRGTRRQQRGTELRVAVAEVLTWEATHGMCKEISGLFSKRKGIAACWTIRFLIDSSPLLLQDRDIGLKRNVWQNRLGTIYPDLVKWRPIENATSLHHVIRFEKQGQREGAMPARYVFWYGSRLPKPAENGLYVIGANRLDLGN